MKTDAGGKSVGMPTITPFSLFTDTERNGPDINHQVRLSQRHRRVGRKGWSSS